MKKLILFLIRYFADDREFRINVCKELHYNAQNYFGEQTGYGRFYEACGEFFEAAPEYVNPNAGFDVSGGIIAEYKEVRERLKPICPSCNRLMRRTFIDEDQSIYECVYIKCMSNQL